MTANQIRRNGRRKIATVLAAALLGGGAMAASAEPARAASGSWAGGPPSFSELVDEVKPAVVNIAIKGKTPVATGMRGQPMPRLPEGSPFAELFPHFFQNGPGGSGGMESEREFSSVGSGFIISAEGLVVTNNHVIEHADEIEVILQDGTRHPAKVRGRDAKTDLALLEIDVDDSLAHVELSATDDAKVGDWVVAVGNPFGLGGTVTAGIISARGRDIQSGPFDDYIQIDASINRGNSGGPLFDTQGQVIGINTAIYTPSGGSVGIGFAIPASMAREVVAQLEAEGSVARGWLGVQIQPVTQEVAESLDLKREHGALVASVMPDSPASRAGLRAGDVIVRMDGEELEDFKDLPRLVARAKAGSEAELEVRRQGKKRRLEVEIGHYPTEDGELASLQPDHGTEGRPLGELGIQLAELTPEARQRYGIATQSAGVLVAGIEQGSPAARAGIRAGSVISMVGQAPVETPDDLVAQVERAQERKRASVLLLVEHRGEKRFVAVKLARA